MILILDDIRARAYYLQCWFTAFVEVEAAASAGEILTCFPYRVCAAAYSQYSVAWRLSAEYRISSSRPFPIVLVFVICIDRYHRVFYSIFIVCNRNCYFVL